MSNHLRWLAVLALPLVILAAQPATAELVINARSFVCGGSGPEDASVAVTSKGSTLTLQFRAKDLTPFETVECGYFCNSVGAGGFEVPCGTIDKTGKWSRKLELPLILCYGLIPFFNAGSNGVCVPATAP